MCTESYICTKKVQPLIIIENRSKRFLPLVQICTTLHNSLSPCYKYVPCYNNILLCYKNSDTNKYIILKRNSVMYTFEICWYKSIKLLCCCLLCTQTTQYKYPCPKLLGHQESHFVYDLCQLSQYTYIISDLIVTSF